MRQQDILGFWIFCGDGRMVGGIKSFLNSDAVFVVCKTRLNAFRRKDKDNNNNKQGRNPIKKNKYSRPTILSSDSHKNGDLE